MVQILITPNNLHSSKHVVTSLNHVPLGCNMRTRTIEECSTNSISLAMKRKENFSFTEKVTSIVAWDHALSLLSFYVSHGKRAFFFSLSSQRNKEAKKKITPDLRLSLSPLDLPRIFGKSLCGRSPTTRGGGDSPYERGEDARRLA